jgi:hypothetical protein
MIGRNGETAQGRNGAKVYGTTIIFRKDFAVEPSSPSIMFENKGLR